MPRIPAINLLLDDEVRMASLQELAETGASIGTIEAKLEMPPGRLRMWLEKGKVKPKTAYRFLYMKFRSWAAEARAAAESQQLAKTPSAWLDRNTSARIVEDSSDPSSNAPALLGQPQQAPINQLALGAQSALASLRILAESGVDINQALKKATVAIEHESTSD